MNNLVIALLLGLACTLCDPTRANPVTRVRRQGWSWGGDDDFTRPTATPPPTSSLGSLPTQQSTSGPADDPNSTTTTASPLFSQCMTQCRTTQQYNPVCGSNRVTYDNVGRLQCAQNCGVDVLVLFNGTCAPVTR